MRTIEENKKLCEEMPYLAIRNVWTGKIMEDYDYSYIEGDYDLPEGWRPLFLQMCRDIRKPLEDAGLLNEFYFTQVKEKYNTLRAYNSGATKEVNEILDKYEYISQFVCQDCGAPATKIMRGYIAGYCDKCAEKIDRVCDEMDPFNPIMHFIRFTGDGKEEFELDCSEEWNRFYAGRKEN